MRQNTITIGLYRPHPILLSCQQPAGWGQANILLHVLAYAVLHMILISLVICGPE
ncbi:hypothetical protein [Pedobacter sp. SYP-B3415]|uniref:hypothetical protein n=1 Tax=Pedobacter sp. SYP-B3415 TaxID=2496641 RepID=UPI0013E9C6B4|nr:hypothetical protein [Pedobacter sp. SYP-B3415]